MTTFYAQALEQMRAHAELAVDALEGGHENTARHHREAMLAWAAVVQAERADGRDQGFGLVTGSLDSSAKEGL